MKSLTSDQWKKLYDAAEITVTQRYGFLELNDTHKKIILIWVKFNFESNFNLEPKIVFFTVFSQMPPNELSSVFNNSSTVSEFILGLHHYYSWENLAPAQIERIELLSRLMSEFATDKIHGGNTCRIC